MKSFKQFLNEFKKARDSDWDFKSKAVIIFDPNDIYKRQGQTHGLMSHAIKHGREFFEQDYIRILNDIKNFVKSKKFWLFRKNKKIDVWNPNDNIGFNLLSNTLDRINDKKELNQKLTKEEIWIYEKMLKIKDLYEKELNNFIKSTNTNKFENNDNTIYYDLKKLYFAIESDNKIETFFTFKTKDKLLNKIENLKNVK